MKKIIVAVTGASGAIYARKVMEHILRSEDVEQIAVIFSRNGRAVMEYEEEKLPEDPRIRIFDNDDMFAAPASGSAGYDAMAIVPCSVGSAGRIAAGISSDLIGRAADVMLKLSECGAVILPACPSFYSRPADMEQLCDTVASRAAAMLGLHAEGYEWQGKDND